MLAQWGVGGLEELSRDFWSRVLQHDRLWMLPVSGPPTSHRGDKEASFKTVRARDPREPQPVPNPLKRRSAPKYVY